MKDWQVYLACYMVGCITLGPILARLKGVDLRAVGSGNIGATNVLRALGKGYALATLLGDGLKGSLAVWIGGLVLTDPVSVGICGLCGILGHNFPVFLRFRGGKGVATSLGALAVYVPLAALGFTVVWLTVFRIWRTSSLSALAAFSAALSIVFAMQRAAFPVVLAMFVLSLIMHRGNIRRLVQGTEPRVGGNK